MITRVNWLVDTDTNFDVVVLGTPSAITSSSSPDDKIFNFGVWSGYSPQKKWFISASDLATWSTAQNEWTLYQGGAGVYQGDMTKPLYLGYTSFNLPTPTGNGLNITPNSSADINQMSNMWSGGNQAAMGTAPTIFGRMTFVVMALDRWSEPSSWQWAMRYWNTNPPQAAP
jgi:hypothetical protein